MHAVVGVGACGESANPLTIEYVMFIWYRMMQSRFQCWLLVNILLTFSCLLGPAEGQTCRNNYTMLADTLLSNSDNKYQLSLVFFPIDRTPPSFVNVTYKYDDTDITNETWLWSAGTFYFFQPLRIYQFSSLFFGIPHFRSDNIMLMLPAECANTQVQIMETLTQRVRDACAPGKTFCLLNPICRPS